MKKKEKNFNAFSISVIAILLVAICGTGVYAYYQTQISAKGSMRAKAWVFKATAGGEELSEIFSDSIGNLQPGSKGSYTITVDATGTEVDLTYKIELGYAPESEKITNLKFCTDEACENELSSTNTLTGEILASSTTKTKDVKIYYVWPYGDASSVAADTADAGKSVTLNLKVSGTQKNNS